jgi:hypothetical protein
MLFLLASHACLDLTSVKSILENVDIIQLLQYIQVLDYWGLC